jgi:hypothetical protein
MHVWNRICSLQFQLSTDFRHTSIYSSLIQASITISFSHTIAALSRTSPPQSPTASLPTASTKQMESADPEGVSDSDEDMSAGARLMRYNISDELLLDCQSFDLEPRRRSSNTRPPQRTADGKIDGTISIGRSLPGLDHFPEDHAVFHRYFAKRKDDVFYNIVDFHPARKTMLGVPIYRPLISLINKGLTWRSASGLKGRARPRGVSKRGLLLTIKATRTTTRAASKQVTWSLPLPLSPTSIQYQAVKTSTATRSRSPQSQEGQCSHIDHTCRLHFVRTPKGRCVLAGL